MPKVKHTAAKAMASLMKKVCPIKKKVPSGKQPAMDDTVQKSDILILL
jgi:hypothetical protein